MSVHWGTMPASKLTSFCCARCVYAFEQRVADMQSPCARGCSLQQALERLADIATALCKALPFPRLSHINKSDDDGVQTSFADDAGRDGDVIRHAHTQLHQCLAACLLIMRPRLERTLEEGAFECGDWSVADSDRSKLTYHACCLCACCLCSTVVATSIGFRMAGVRADREGAFYFKLVRCHSSALVAFCVS